MTTAVSTFESAAHCFAALVRRIPADAWDGPGLGDWNLRSLVGHTSRSLITVSTYLKSRAEREDIATPQQYYVWTAEYISNSGAQAITERGRQAGRDLGDDPVGAIDALLVRARDDVAAAGDPLIEVIGGLGIRLHTYLPTRVFELAVHSLDIARATGLSLDLPDDVLTEATVLATRVAVLTGRGAELLMSLTGRTSLPPGFSVV